MAGEAGRGAQAQATRESILVAAERLFAERGVYAVSNRQVGEAAGQGNNTVVSYHFGTKAELVRSIAHRHLEPIETVRMRLVAGIRDRAGIREWVSCLVRPVTEHLEALGSPTWYARFSAQVMTDPTLHRIMIEESVAFPAMWEILEQVDRCLGGLPVEVHEERTAMASQLIVHMCAERERALAENTPTPRSCWQDTATGLTDAIVGLWLAPVTTRPADGEPRP